MPKWIKAPKKPQSLKHFKDDKTAKKEAFAKCEQFLSTRLSGEPALVYFVDEYGDIREATLTKVDNKGLGKKLGLGRGYSLKIQFDKSTDSEEKIEKTYTDPRQIHLTRESAFAQLEEMARKLKEKQTSSKNSKTVSENKISSEETNGVAKDPSVPLFLASKEASKNGPDETAAAKARRESESQPEAESEPPQEDDDEDSDSDAGDENKEETKKESEEKVEEQKVEDDDTKEEKEGEDNTENENEEAAADNKKEDDEKDGEEQDESEVASESKKSSEPEQFVIHTDTESEQESEQEDEKNEEKEDDNENENDEAGENEKEKDNSFYN